MRRAVIHPRSSTIFPSAPSVSLYLAPHLCPRSTANETRFAPPRTFELPADCLLTLARFDLKEEDPRAGGRRDFIFTGVYN